MENQPNKSRKTATKITKATTALSDMGKLPPQAVDLEKAVLGAMMLEKNAVTDTIDILSQESFYDPKHQYIFGTIKELFGTSKPIDILTVTNQLKKNGELQAAGGAAYISQLTSRIASTAHVEFHARVISEKYIKRELIRMSSEVMKDAYDETNDVFDVLNKAEGDLFKIAENNMGKSVDVMQNVVREAIEEIEKAAQNTDGISGVPTGFYGLDKVTAGFQRSDMIVLAARPAMGKTAFVLSMARNTAVEFNMGVAIFSLEMSSVQLVKRLISAEARLPAEKLRKGDLREDEFQQLHSRITKLSTAPLYIDDTPGISIFDLRAKCRRLKMQYDIQMVVIDYLQLMTAGGSKGQGNREQEISSISRSIKEIAKELNIPIIALSQLSRSVEQRGGDKKPILSDLRESGAIEQDADIVSFIYRPEYYGFLQDEDGNSNAGIGEIIIAKHRNGALDNIRLRFIKEYARFENLDSNFDTPGLSGGPSAAALTNESLTANNNNFDQESGTYTIPSKMNSLDEPNEDFDPSEGGEAPF
ncbi:replicative DNA helicase [Crocinitomicaceae bacterium]|nr:replicative DNA helicase [Crocinitomicaceae bacterium]